MYLKKAIDNFLEDSVIYKSKGYYDFEISNSKLLLKYFGNIKTETITKESIINYIQFSKGQIKNSTINKRIALLKRIYKFNNVKCNFIDIKKLKEDFSTFGILTDIEKIRDISLSLSLQNQAIINVYLDTGIRLNELVNIQWTMVDLNNRFMRLTITKNKRVKIAYFTNITQALLFRLKESNKNQPYVFTSRDGKNQISKNTITGLFRYLRLKYGINNLSSHRFRHSFATNLYNEGADLYFIMELMGHSSIDVTRIYLHSDTKRNLEKYDKLKK